MMAGRGISLPCNETAQTLYPTVGMTDINVFEVFVCCPLLAATRSASAASIRHSSVPWVEFTTRMHVSGSSVLKTSLVFCWIDWPSYRRLLLLLSKFRPSFS